MAWGFIWWGFSRLGLDLVGFSRARHAYIHRGLVADGKLDFANPTVSQSVQSVQLFSLQPLGR